MAPSEPSTGINSLILMNMLLGEILTIYQDSPF
jgi:hypothetical protein